MMALQRILAVTALLASVTASTPSPQALDTDLTILMHNDLQGVDSPYLDSAVILLGASVSRDEAAASCEALGEALWSPITAENSTSSSSSNSSIQTDLDYLVYQGKATNESLFWVASDESGSARTISASGAVSVVVGNSSLSLPAICTQSAPLATSEETDNSTEWQVSVRSNDEDLVGFRDRTSFRFYGVRYAPQPERFTYSELYTGSNATVSATSFRSECAQSTTLGSEDCLFLNIWTPYLPRPEDEGDKSKLKPVMFWIHGGAFSGGTGSDNTFDGGSLASRGDVVVVTINYRLTTLGFLALDDGVTNGNFGLADQITALDWVRAHVADFGGDPDRITIFGQSAGAASVRAIMASPVAHGKFAAAIPQSNLGGLFYGTSYSEYYTIAQEMQIAGNAILAATNCTNATSQVACLRAVPLTTLLGLSVSAAYVVQDGTYITSPHLPLSSGVSPAPYKLLMGTMRDDAAPFIPYPTTTNQTAYLAAAGLPPPPADLFPLPTTSPNQTLNLYNMTSRYATDAMFRCADLATVQAGLTSGLWDKVYYYELTRSYQLKGYPGTDVCEPPRTESHPNGDPTLPYFRCHSGDLYEVFGNIAFQGLPLRDEADLPFEQLVVDAWASFARTGNPNPEEGFLVARGFGSTLDVLGASGRWAAATRGDLTLRALGWPPRQEGFGEGAQCDGLGLPLTYYE